jgi:predicted aminopeptidase
MLGWSDVQLASIVFHELTHQLLYVANDSAFNEALATTLEQEGVQRWLRSLGRERDLAAYLEQQDRYTQVVALLIEARTRLNRVYAQSLDREEMRRLKAQEFAALRARFEALKSHWKGHAPYEAWFAQELNNAHLASVATYYVCVPGFTRELHAVHGDLPRFYARARELGKLPFAERQRLLCGGG